MRPDEQQAFETELSRVFLAGDHTETLRRLIDGYGPEILGYLSRTMNDEQAADDVFSDFCEDLCRSIGRFERRSLFRTWAYRLATSARARFWEDPYRRRGERLVSEEIGKIEQQVRTETHAWMRTEVKTRFAELRRFLDAEEQTLLTLRIDKDLSWEEIAEVMTPAAETVDDRVIRKRASSLRQRFKRLKDKIRRLADEHGIFDRPVE